MSTPSAVYALGETPTIRIEHCESDLVILAHAEPTVILTASEMPHSIQREGQLTIEECEDDLGLRVPHNTVITIHHIAGDLRAEGIARLEVHDLSGDAAVRAVSAACVMHRVEGDLHARAVNNLALGVVQGDLSVDDATGTLAVEEVQGDARLRGAPAGFGPTYVAGDLTLDINFTPGASYRAKVDGDVTVHVPAGADLELEATVEGDVAGLETSSHHGHHNHITATWGEGSARLEITGKGDLSVRHHEAPSTRHAATAAAPAQQPPFNDVAAEETLPHSDDSVLAVLEALARGDISTAEADDLLTQRR